MHACNLKRCLNKPVGYWVIYASQYASYVAEPACTDRRLRRHLDPGCERHVRRNANRRLAVRYGERPQRSGWWAYLLAGFAQTRAMEGLPVYPSGSVLSSYWKTKNAHVCAFARTYESNAFRNRSGTARCGRTLGGACDRNWRSFFPCRPCSRKWRGLSGGRTC